MEKGALYDFAKKIARHNDFSIKKKIYEASFLTKGSLNNAIYHLNTINR